jgi:hypothetical protein
LNKEILENRNIKQIYETLERNVLILIAIPIPFFAVTYLNSLNSIFSINLPEVSPFWDSFGLGMVVLILIVHYFNFHSAIKRIQLGNFDLQTKLALYSQATQLRFYILFVASLLCATGLLFFENAGYTIVFAVILLFFSLGKPSPDRIVRLLKLKGEEKDKVMELKRRGAI